MRVRYLLLGLAAMVLSALVVHAGVLPAAADQDAAAHLDAAADLDAAAHLDAAPDLDEAKVDWSKSTRFQKLTDVLKEKRMNKNINKDDVYNKIMIFLQGVLIYLRSMIDDFLTKLSEWTSDESATTDYYSTTEATADDPGTTTVDQMVEFCRVACTEGAAGLECNCPGYPVG